MGYACPVCETPQSDGEHLANHLAFTAMLGDDEHAAWLDEHAPGWEDEGPDELAPRVTDHVEEAEYPQVFDDTRPPDHDHDHQFEEELQRSGGYGRTAGAGAQDADTQRILNEARRMTEEMLSEDDADDESAEDGDET
ncbi:DUF5810 domain-containing protein [Halomicrococcus gelatinilyticus]|uniref:DUF5810 domain-containing protein n=1 Tax=Halomicrococcus gelatinilyticus TaxID=1702103 RepID=UPI002E1225D3